MNLFSSEAAAADLGISPARVRQLAQSLNLGQRIGRDWVFTAANLAAMRERRDGRAGRLNPRKYPSMDADSFPVAGAD